ncbi:PTS sugar transporter subunit IIA [Subtercola boreus]|uniref:Mannitol-specific phosphotransferase enzyme IIA component n=1 Tax=Subtercola boreus TaxID=120213 RepID=A0A3E0WBK4_9MICO|nr:PTS sugar transporter subunit IIA [Subtercola boreus]RFA19427.1 PTS mannitol transporter subunit IIA [Subtercola boreus]RFA19688.1 PTS mannitol transporter subunit IIA [Subtercola boreus]RFA26053.1 PTS mannitol transporter subunit IIA [Subtercola boreus]
MGDVLTQNSIKINGSASTKEEAIAEANELLLAAGAVTNDYLASMLERETSVSTYMGNYLAIPHGTNEGKDAILASALSFVRYSKPIDWDGQEVRFVVGIAGKEGGHLDILSKIALIFSDDDEVQKLLKAPSDEAVYALLSEVNED